METQMGREKDYETMMLRQRQAGPVQDTHSRYRRNVDATRRTIRDRAR